MIPHAQQQKSIAAQQAGARYEARRRSLVAQSALGQMRAQSPSPTNEHRSRPTTAAQLVEAVQMRLSPEARELISAAMTPVDLFELLLQRDLDADARRVLACAMPRRRALWWGCLASWDALDKLATGASARVLQAIARYVAQPCDDHCREVAAAGQHVKRASLMGCLVYGTFVAHGSVLGPDKPRVPAPPHVFGRLMESAIYLASVTKDVRNYRVHLREYLLLGQQLAGGPPPWRDLASQEDAQGVQPS